ncbi:hypothetical protein CRENPOLYSF2_200008 [Crenothrix polyspora]|jgi:histidine decarboxylase|uniref:ACT domain-containing protein n=1 Tax=Crenothrix polyspora TaxID=360316 RepID=A0A1R4H479_9GAMM|nr:ACT domain-containing protein [Crenothrix polyspora]SJM91052.1 hypothetical protein CRENPOLYSF2_200008 [Crenothrix polyspora]
MKQIHIVSTGGITVFTELTEALARADINIESVDVEQVGDSTVMVLNVDQYDRALQCLREFQAIQVVTEDAILVKLKNKPGALAQIARRFTDAGISLRSVRFIQRDNDFALVAISTDRSEAALALVADVSLF